MGNAGYGNHTDKTKDYVDSERPDPQAGHTGEAGKQTGEGKRKDGEMPSAGPHDKPSLTNPDATPGTGVLPNPGEQNGTTSTGG